MLRGERFSWPAYWSSKLKKDSARRLLEKVLKLYEEHTHARPSRVVAHKSSRFNVEEIEVLYPIFKGLPGPRVPLPLEIV